MNVKRRLVKKRFPALTLHLIHCLTVSRVIFLTMSCLREFLLCHYAVLINNSLAYSNVQVVLGLIRPQLTSLRVVLVLPHQLETLSKIITKLRTEKHTNI